MVFMTNGEEREIVETALRSYLGPDEGTDVYWNGEHFCVEPATSSCYWQDYEFEALRDSPFHVQNVYEGEYGVGVMIGVETE
jgi:hypothetical protein